MFVVGLGLVGIIMFYLWGRGSNQCICSLCGCKSKFKPYLLIH